MRKSYAWLVVLVVAAVGVFGAPLTAAASTPAPAASLVMTAGHTVGAVSGVEAGSALIVPRATPLTAGDPWKNLDHTWRKTANFAGCIFGVGVPIGLAIAFIGSPVLWRFVLGLGPMPASWGAAADKYIRWVKDRCAYSLR